MKLFTSSKRVAVLQWSSALFLFLCPFKTHFDQHFLRLKEPFKENTSNYSKAIKAFLGLKKKGENKSVFHEQRTVMERRQFNELVWQILHTFQRLDVMFEKSAAFISKICNIMGSIDIKKKSLTSRDHDVALFGFC